MSDTIYREDAIKAIHNYWKKRLDTLPAKESEYGAVYADIQQMDKILEHNKALCNFIKAIPSADRPQGGWIPCSERLPKEEGNYLVTFGAFAEIINGEKVIFGDIDGSVAEIGYGCYERDIFWQPTAFGWYDLYTAEPFDKRAIIAWMPLPEPWKGADDE